MQKSGPLLSLSGVVDLRHGHVGAEAQIRPSVRSWDDKETPLASSFVGFVGGTSHVKGRRLHSADGRAQPIER